MNETKRLRLLARVREIEDKLERLTADLPGEWAGEADRAYEEIKEIRAGLEKS